MCVCGSAAPIKAHTKLLWLAENDVEYKKEAIPGFRTVASGLIPGYPPASTLDRQLTATVEISNAGTDGYVIADAVQFLPVETANRGRAAK